MKSPVAFFIFKREEYTQRVWVEIRKAKPPVLLVVADGPRNENERQKCEVTRAITEKVDWPCDVRRNYSSVNMGCRNRIASGLSWVFEEVEEAIILEDDCLPDQSFFLFCDTLLEHYRHDPRVMHIGGNNVQKAENQDPCNYYFSRCIHIWGWATWRRAWRHFDRDVTSWPQVKNKGLLRSVCSSRGELAFWVEIFDRQYRGASKSWAYSWVFAIWSNYGIAIVPGVNLVSNIGLGADSTHQQDDKWYMNMPTEPLTGIKHPEVMMVNVGADRWTYNRMFKPSLWERCRGTVLNPWAYAMLLRKIPVVGPLWARWRTWCKSRP